MAIKRILVPVDFSADSLNALAYARDFGTRFGAELLILYVIEPIYYATPADMYVASPNVALLLEEQRRIGNEQMKRIGTDLQKKGARFRTMIKGGAPAQMIVDTAKSTRADLIVMATHGHTGLAHMLMGSVAEKVVRTAACPVLTVRHGVKGAKPRKQRTAAKGR